MPTRCTCAPSSSSRSPSTTCRRARTTPAASRCASRASRAIGPTSAPKKPTRSTRCERSTTRSLPARRADALRAADRWRRRDDAAVLHRQRRTGLERRAHGAVLAVEPIVHVVADELLRLLLHRPAAMLGRRHDVLVLHVLLDAVAGVAAGCGAGDGRDRLALAAADRAAEQAAGDGTDRGAGDAVLVPHRRLVLHGDVLAMLARRDDGLHDVLHRDHLGELRLRERAIAGDCAGA